MKSTLSDSSDSLWLRADQPLLCVRGLRRYLWAQQHQEHLARQGRPEEEIRQVNNNQVEMYQLVL